MTEIFAIQKSEKDFSSRVNDSGGMLVEIGNTDTRELRHSRQRKHKATERGRRKAPGHETSWDAERRFSW